MTNQFESEAVQPSRNLLQDLMQLPAEGVGAAIVIGLCAVDIYPWWIALIILGFGWWIISNMKAQQALKEAKARAATYANCIGPVVVSSIHPNETLVELQARASEWREQLRLSGNPYAEKIPIVLFPYNVMLLEHGQLTAGWSTYCRTVGERQHIENLKWYESGCPNELRGLFASAVLPAPKQQEI
jgi:hypothetical protein